MNTENLTDKEKVLVLSALDNLLIEVYDEDPLEDEKFDLIEAKIVELYDIKAGGGEEEIKPMLDDLHSIRVQLIDEILK